MHLYVEITNKYINKSHFQKMVFIDNEKKNDFPKLFPNNSKTIYKPTHPKPIFQIYNYWLTMKLLWLK